MLSESSDTTSDEDQRGESAAGNAQSHDQAPRQAHAASVRPTRPTSVPPLDIAAAVRVLEDAEQRGQLNDEGRDGSASSHSGAFHRYACCVLLQRPATLHPSQISVCARTHDVLCTADDVWARVQEAARFSSSPPSSASATSTRARPAPGWLPATGDSDTNAEPAGLGDSGLGTDSEGRSSESKSSLGSDSESGVQVARRAASSLLPASEFSARPAPSHELQADWSIRSARSGRCRNMSAGMCTRAHAPNAPHRRARSTADLTNRT